MFDFKNQNSIYDDASSELGAYGKHQSRQHLINNIRQPFFPLNSNDCDSIQLNKHRSSFDNEDKSTQPSQSNFGSTTFGKNINQGINNNINDLQSIKTQGGMGSNSSRTNKDEDDFDLSFDEDFFLDIQRGIDLCDE